MDAYTYDLGGGWKEVTPSEYLHASHLGQEIAETRRGVPLSPNYEHRYWIREGVI